MKIDAITQLIQAYKPVGTAKLDLAGAAELDNEESILRTVFSRIKYSRLTRGQRDSLCSMVKSMAADDRMDYEQVRGILDLIFLMEMAARNREQAESKNFPLEKSVDQEIDSVFEQRAERQEQREKVESLRDTLSVIA
ncbi:MAG TPA: hypothetical protein PLN69_08065 [bacterium]|nr:hypothetical protein [bacterium]